MSLYRDIRDQILSVWTANWTHTDVPVYWRSNDADPLPDPSDTAHFLRNEIEFDRERIVGFGGGRGQNLKCLQGTVLFYVFSSRQLQNEDVGLDLLSDAVAAFRSQRVGGLSFLGDTYSFDAAQEQSPEEAGNWFVRGTFVVFEYRFNG